MVALAKAPATKQPVPEVRNLSRDQLAREEWHGVHAKRNRGEEHCREHREHGHESSRIRPKIGVHLGASH